MLAKFACSPATSRRPAGCSATGQLLPISENETLFQLIGTTYGGDGQSTFALPDLRGRIPIHQGSGFILGETGGVETVTLTVQQMPRTQPSAAGIGQTPGPRSNPGNNVVAGRRSTATPYFEGQRRTIRYRAQSVSAVGGSQPHNNFQPYLCVNFIISLFGIFPTPT